MLCSLGHDDIQYWLLQKQNRDKILKKLGLHINNHNIIPFNAKVEQEKRYKPDYEPEIFVDILETRELILNMQISLVYWERERHRYIGFSLIAEDFEVASPWTEWSPWQNKGSNIKNLNWTEEALAILEREGYVYGGHREQNKEIKAEVCRKLGHIFRTRDIVYCYKIIWEIKPELTDLGQTLRQLQKYKAIVKPNSIILVYHASKIPDIIIQDYFCNQNILTYKILPSECKRLEEYKI